MICNEPFVDLHCHLLPGLDDGAATLDEALAMAKMAVADGVRTIVATPHQLGKNAKNSGAMIREAVAHFQQILAIQKIPLQVLPGADVRIDPELVRKIRMGEVLSLADRGRHVLLELPHDVYLPLDRLLSEMRISGIVGILSHPERNLGILKQPEVLGTLVREGCLLQVTAGSLTGLFGPQIQRFTESIIQQGLVHFISSDAHSTGSRSPILSAAFGQVVKLVGEETALNLCCRHPAAVAAGRTISPVFRKSTTFGWPGWFRRTFTSDVRLGEPI